MIWFSWPLPAFYCEFGRRPRVPRVHGLELQAPRRSRHLFRMSRLAPLVGPLVYQWARMWPSWPLPALYCDFGCRPRVPLVHGLGLFRSQARSKNAFRMARLAPLVSPRVTRGRGCGPLGVSLHYIASWDSCHGFHGSTGWGCSAPGRRAKGFSHGTACTTGRSTGYP